MAAISKPWDRSEQSQVGLAPDVLVYQKYFAFQPNLANTRFDIRGRIYSYFVAPSNGLYRFYMRSDDAAQLYMNTNAVNSTDPAGAVLLGQLNAFTSAYTSGSKRASGRRSKLLYQLAGRTGPAVTASPWPSARRVTQPFPPIGPIVDVAPAGSSRCPPDRSMLARLP